jgi:hypothetical protein
MQFEGTNEKCGGRLEMLTDEPNSLLSRRPRQKEPICQNGAANPNYFG